VNEFAIEACEVSKTYRKRWSGRAVKALDGFSLSVPRGSCFGLIGPHGAGKTTFIKILCSSLRPDSGSVRIFGKPPGGAKLQAYPTGISFLESKVRATGLLVLDDPFRGVADAGRLRILALLRERESAGATILFSSQQIGDAESLCDEIAILRDGKLVAKGTLEDLRMPRGFRMVVGGLPDRMQEELAASGYVVGLTRTTCWIESPSRENLNPLINRMRAAGICIQSVENVGSMLERYLIT
jgi:ABC-type multidrug transport system ATPase subunit